jgi:hypothetical protein
METVATAGNSSHLLHFISFLVMYSHVLIYGEVTK